MEIYLNQKYQCQFLNINFPFLPRYVYRLPVVEFPEIYRCVPSSRTEHRGPRCRYHALYAICMGLPLAHQHQSRGRGGVRGVLPTTNQSILASGDTRVSRGGRGETTDGFDGGYLGRIWEGGGQKGVRRKGTSRGQGRPNTKTTVVAARENIPE